MRTSQEYKVDRYLRAAIELQALDKSLAYKTLNSFLKEHSDSQSKVPGKMIVDINGVAPLCRMVFTKRQGADFRRPRYGNTRFTCATSDDWSLEPIEIVDGVPFHLTFVRTINGYPPEHPLDYVSYCIENCDWNSFRFEMKSDAQKQEALSKFLDLPKIKGGITDWCKKIYSEQIR